MATFRDASRGTYDKESKDVSRFREEIFERGSSLIDDKRNMMGDRLNIAKDVRKTFNEIVLENG